MPTSDLYTQAPVPERRLPSPLLPRFAVLTIVMRGGRRGYVIFDCRTARITNGVSTIVDDALANATYAEACGADAAHMTPDAEGLGLLFPVPDPRTREAV